jgi:hypothetical protein
MPKRLARNSSSAEKQRQGPRKRADMKPDGRASQRQKRVRRERASVEKQGVAERAAAAAAAAAEAAAEKELLGGDLSGKDIRFLARCLGVKEQYQRHVDVICKLVRANLRWGVRGGER